MVIEKRGKVENVSKSDRMAKSSDKKRKLGRKDLVSSYVCKVPKKSSFTNDILRICEDISQLLRHDMELTVNAQAAQALVSEALALMKKPDGGANNIGGKAMAEGTTTK